MTMTAQVKKLLFRTRYFHTSEQDIFTLQNKTFSHFRTRHFYTSEKDTFKLHQKTCSHFRTRPTRHFHTLEQDILATTKKCGLSRDPGRLESHLCLKNRCLFKYMQELKRSNRSSKTICFLRYIIATDKRGYSHNIFLTSPWKHMLWVFIRSASANVCLRGEIRKISAFFEWKKRLICYYGYMCFIWAATSNKSTAQ